MLPAKLWVRTRLCPRPGHVLWMPPVTDDPCIIQICHQIRHDIVVIQTSRMGYTHCRHDSGDAVCGDPYYRWQCGVTDGDSLWWHCWWHCSVTAGDSLMGHILRRQFVTKVKLLLAMHCVLMVLLKHIQPTTQFVVTSIANDTLWYTIGGDCWRKSLSWHIQLVMLSSVVN